MEDTSFSNTAAETKTLFLVENQSGCQSIPRHSYGLGQSPLSGILALWFSSALTGGTATFSPCRHIHSCLLGVSAGPSGLSGRCQTSSLRSVKCRCGVTRLPNYRHNHPIRSRKGQRRLHQSCAFSQLRVSVTPPG